MKPKEQTQDMPDDPNRQFDLWIALNVMNIELEYFFPLPGNLDRWHRLLNYSTNIADTFKVVHSVMYNHKFGIKAINLTVEKWLSQTQYICEINYPHKVEMEKISVTDESPSQAICKAIRHVGEKYLKDLDLHWTISTTRKGCLVSISNPGHWTDGATGQVLETFVWGCVVDFLTNVKTPNDNTQSFTTPARIEWKHLNIAILSQR